MKPKVHIIGGTEKVSFPTLNVKKVAAKVDTGADISSIWCSDITRGKEGIECVFFGLGSPHYTGEKYLFKKGDYKISRVHSSFGHRQKRYKVKLPVVIGGRRILASFTLADRSAKNYPVLVGRRLLARKFLVDVTLTPARIRKRFKRANKVAA